ncbi:DMT family transporter [Pseudooceanicola sp. CBS1P-1]|uniref:EamA-like transporter family protein n=1 Tax=Pseudooceanicola albus TaxID=2692189 RepID=A0A6L7G897_9RHOB|nr:MULTISPECIES: DMT family transporter [Pseudooceanicola]MBT9386225.1 DMT family transporter [Pseudooceanicola endophyticus]MXN20275.1 EamA-like transporter family protein [Pseudooceanicola albus]
MKQLLTLAVVLAAGMGLSVEAGLLGPLGEMVGHMSATFCIFLVGSLLLSLALIFAPRRSLPQLFSQPRWMLNGGVLGPVYVVVITTATPLLGVGTTMVAILFGQVATGLLLDHFGAFGAARQKVDGYRLGALALIAGALALIH